MPKYQTNGDRILQAIINDKNLIEYYDYNPNEFSCIEEALNSEYPIINAIAQIIYGMEQKETEKEIYNKVYNYSKSNI